MTSDDSEIGYHRRMALAAANEPPAAVNYTVRLDPAMMARLGHQARVAGFGEDEIVALVSDVEKIAFKAASTAAHAAAMEMFPLLLGHVHAIHQETVRRCDRAVREAHRGIVTGLLNNHMPCLTAIAQVGQQSAQRPAN